MTRLFMAVSGVLVAGGVLALGIGIPIKDFSTGNLLIVVGVMAIGFGLLLLALSAILGELQRLTAAPGMPARSGAMPPAPERPVPERPAFAPAPPSELRAPHPPAPELFAPDEPEPVAPSDSYGKETPPWALPPREATIPEPPSAPPRPSHREAAVRRPPPLARGVTEHPAVPAPASAAEYAPESVEAPAPQGNMFDSLWPQRPGERVVRKPFRLRPGTPADQPVPENAAPPAPAAFETGASASAEPASAAADAPPVVLKSGVIDGMAYSLFSDGSIEAELADGTIRFASLDELRAHLDRRA